MKYNLLMEQKLMSKEGKVTYCLYVFFYDLKAMFKIYQTEEQNKLMKQEGKDFNLINHCQFSMNNGSLKVYYM